MGNIAAKPQEPIAHPGKPMPSGLKMGKNTCQKTRRLARDSHRQLP
jgi:hypothetical protein